MDCIEHNQKGRCGGYGGTTWNMQHIGLHVKAYCQAHGLLRVPSGLVVRHKCDNPRCVNPEHLELGTTQDNTQDRVDRGRNACGSNHGRAVLSEEDVRRIRTLLGQGVSQRKIAVALGVSQRTIGRIHRGELWTSVN